MIRTTAICEISMIKQPTIKIVIASQKILDVQGNGRKEKGTLPCLTLEGDWNYAGSVKVFPKIFKIAEGSK